MGIILECVQGALGHRTFEWSDLAANGFGVIAGLALFGTRVNGALAWAEARLFPS